MPAPIIPLSIFLKNAKPVLRNLIQNQNGVDFIKLLSTSGTGGQVVELLIPLISPTSIDIDAIFNINTFLNNWFFIYGTTFPPVLTSNLTSVPVNIVNDLAAISIPATITNFFSFEFNLFRQLCCIFFTMFAIKLTECVCIPSSYSELVLFRSGVGINCYKLECAQAIKNNPKMFDGLFCSSNCSQQICMQAILVNVLSGGNSTVNINAQQDCQTIINTVNSTTTTTNNNNNNNTI